MIPHKNQQDNSRESIIAYVNRFEEIIAKSSGMGVSLSENQSEDLKYMIPDMISLREFLSPPRLISDSIKRDRAFVEKDGSLEGHYQDDPATIRLPEPEQDEFDDLGRRHRIRINHDNTSENFLNKSPGDIHHAFAPASPNRKSTGRELSEYDNIHHRY